MIKFLLTLLIFYTNIQYNNIKDYERIITKMNKKNNIFYFLIILLGFLCIFLTIISIKNYKSKLISLRSLQGFYDAQLISAPFSINKIVYFSSATGTSSINSNSSFNISELNQYTDFAIFINNNSTNGFNMENTLKEVKLSDIKLTLSPTIGNPNLYYKNIDNFTTFNHDTNQLLENELDFNISSENQIDYSSPTLFNNCANPITLSYVNSNIVTNYTLMDTNNIAYNGSLLKNCNITLNSISTKISFLITIVNNNDETYTCPMILSVPLSTENSTIYDGNIIYTQNCNYDFVKKIK